MSAKSRDAGYQDTIFESMARTLWLMAYADWVENEGEGGDDDNGDDDPDNVGEGPARPGGGEDWDDFAPETPIAALQAAHELGALVAAANHFEGGHPKHHPMAQLFYQAATIHLGVTFPLYDEPWHSQIMEDPTDKQLRMVYADWLEVQGRVEDAAYVRKASSKDIVDFTGHMDLAKRFGSDLAHMGVGSGVAWSDDHTTKRGAHEFDPEMPHFECYYDGQYLTWSGGVSSGDTTDWNRPSRASGNVQARYEAGGYNEPGITRTDQLGEDLSSYGKREIVYVNQNDDGFYDHRFLLWFGQFSPTYLLIWAAHLEDALDEGIDWLVKNEPGQLVDDQVEEEFKRLKTEREAELGRELSWDDDNEEMSNLIQEAEADTTSGGNASNRIASDAWGIEAEDPSDVDLLRIAGLTKNPDAKREVGRSLSDVAMGLVDLIPNAKKTLESDADRLATFLFKDTVTARMLRELAERGSMPQAEFMRHYMTRSERTPTPVQPWQARERGRKEGTSLPSGFLNNFGRWVINTGWGIPRRGEAKVQRIIRQAYNPVTKQGVLQWAALPPAELVAAMSPAKRQWAYETLENQLLTPRATDNAEETGQWIERLRGPRMNPTKRAPGVQRVDDDGNVIGGGGNIIGKATRSRARPEVISGVTMVKNSVRVAAQHRFVRGK